MSTAIAVEPDELDSLAEVYRGTAASVHGTAGQALVPLPLVMRDPAVAHAGLDDRLRRLATTVRATAEGITGHEVELRVFANAVRARDAGDVVVRDLIAPAFRLAERVARGEVDGWKRLAADG